MLSNFIFSVNIVLPVFIVLFLGNLLKKKKVVSEEFFSNGNKLVFKTALPASLFSSVYSTNTDNLFDLKFVLFTVIATLLCIAVVWLCAALFIKEKSVIGAFVHGAFRGNFAFLGLPLMYNTIGRENSAKAALVLMFTIPLYNIVAVIILSVCSPGSEKIKIKNIILNIIKNPLNIGIFLGVVCSLSNIKLPVIAVRTIDTFAAMATPLALICLGGNLDLSSYNKKLKYSVWAAVLKVIIQPLIVVGTAVLLGFESFDLVVILITFAVPSAVTSYTMTLQMKGDSYVGATNVLVSTFLSVFTLTAFIYFFKAFGVI